MAHKDKSLKIYINQEEKYSITGDNRSVSADKIYEIVGFTIGDHYKVVSENVNNVDKQVMDFFTELFNNITEKANSLSADKTTLEDNLDENFSID